MILEKRTLSVQPFTATILISIENTISNISVFFQAIHSIKRRFGFNIAFVFKGPELLFFNKRVLTAVANAEIDRTLITDRSNCIWLDLMEFAKRQETDYVFFSEAESLLLDWPGILKFITSNLNSDFSFKQSKDGAFAACKQSRLRRLVSDNFESYNDLMQSLARGRVQKQQAYSQSIGDFSLFTSKSGIKRFGGLDKFKKVKHLLFANKKISDAKKIWQIDNRMSLSEFFSQDINQLLDSELITIPGILAQTDAYQVIVDINPGCETIVNSNEQSMLQVPRMLLTVSIVKDALIKEAGMPTAFIMSNFNKGSYIAGALYGIAIQTYEHCSVEIIDDISSDQSITVIKTFASLIDKKHMTINFSVNEKSKGTYWIRNSIIQKLINSNHTYFVNDSDDFSSSQRASIQLAFQEKFSNTTQICFGDIVRVDSKFTILPLDGKVERYGTASLGALASVHGIYGYYENIKKNADTEFIERLKHFGGKDVVRWFRYPILFQPFDGGNLTADIYKVNESGQINQSLNLRDKHRELFKVKHKQLSMAELRSSYPPDTFVYGTDYKTHLKDFLVE